MKKMINLSTLSFATILPIVSFGSLTSCSNVTKYVDVLSPYRNYVAPASMIHFSDSFLASKWYNSAIDENNDILSSDIYSTWSNALTNKESSEKISNFVEFTKYEIHFGLKNCLSDRKGIIYKLTFDANVSGEAKNINLVSDGSYKLQKFDLHLSFSCDLASSSNILKTKKPIINYGCDNFCIMPNSLGQPIKTNADIFGDGYVVSLPILSVNNTESIPEILSSVLNPLSVVSASATGSFSYENTSTGEVTEVKDCDDSIIRVNPHLADYPTMSDYIDNSLSLSLFNSLVLSVPKYAIETDVDPQQEIGLLTFASQYMSKIKMDDLRWEEE